MAETGPTPDGRPSIRKQWANVFAEATAKYERTRTDYDKAEAAYSAGRLADVNLGLPSSDKTTTLRLKMDLAQEFLDKARLAFAQASDSFSGVEREAQAPAAAADSGEKLSASHVALLESLKHSELMAT